ncbi:hypothetical protein K450DRAFT_235254 [Umbelopsis ramanniana AG]|uniref:Uncharacterized protein n=1 Tax=Umbelopsis ramanniana AG TaxID=1314678 RepID=A0AAD5HFP7_UMBRA|nr:uncharacterized protein K450DRAFT_235254 [Umbelopsis ramanniana AG]KAI8580921.1 hypothetical protein K450DRAFT_235254 [Umbelopsis ramanniana AG]
MDITTPQEHIKVEKAPSKANRTPKNKKSNRKSPKTTPKGAVTMTPPTEPQQKSPKKPSNKAVTSPSPRKNTPRNAKKANSSHRKSSVSANSSGSSSAEDNVPQLSYASSGTESDDSDHFDTQLSYDMYAMNINRCVYESPTFNTSAGPALTKLLRYHNSQQAKQAAGHQPRRQKVAIAATQDAKYAGPTFSNAPAPNKLPLPGFNHAQKAATEVELQRRSRDLFNLLVPQHQQPFTPPMNNVYNPPVPQMSHERALTLNEIQQGLRAVLKIQA